MPLYEYHCKTCGDNFEKMLRFNESMLNPECPHCQNRDTHKLISMVASHGAGLATAPSAPSTGSCKSTGPFR